MKEGDTPNTAAEMRSLAEQAEAEAAEAEALAAAARARARAIQLRRAAELVDAPAPAAVETATTEAVAVDTSSTVIGTDDALTASQKTASVITGEPADTPAPEDVATTETADETEPAESDESEVDAGEDRRWLSRRNLSSAATVAAILIVLASVGAGVEMTVLHKNAVRERTRAAEFAAAARQGVVTLTSLDFEHAKEGVKNILDVSTGTFKDDFLKMADDFTNVVEQSKVVSQGTVQSTAVDLDTVTDNSAVVLVASTSEVTNAAGAKQDPRRYRLIVTITRDGGQLKMSKVEFVP